MVVHAIRQTSGNVSEFIRVLKRIHCINANQEQSPTESHPFLILQLNVESRDATPCSAGDRRHHRGKYATASAIGAKGVVVHGAEFWGGSISELVNFPLQSF